MQRDIIHDQVIKSIKPPIANIISSKSFISEITLSPYSHRFISETTLFASRDFTFLFKIHGEDQRVIFILKTSNNFGLNSVYSEKSAEFEQTEQVKYS